MKCKTPHSSGVMNKQDAPRTSASGTLAEHSPYSTLRGINAENKCMGKARHHPLRHKQDKTQSSKQAHETNTHTQQKASVTAVFVPVEEV